MKERAIRATYNDSTIRVYQAYSPSIAKPALAAGRFVPPFKFSRMTWIKPSFCWMMYRSGFASKPGQEIVLGIDITIAGFMWALNHAVLSTYYEPIHGKHDVWKQTLAATPVRVQWDPERDQRLEKIDGVRSIQIGLSGDAVERYVNEWTVGIEDITAIAHRVGRTVERGQLPIDSPSNSEREFPPGDFARQLRMEA